MSISKHKPKPCNFRPAHGTKIDLDPRTKNKSSSISTLKPGQFPSRTQKQSLFRPHHWNQVHLCPPLIIKSTSTPRRKNPVIFDRAAANKSFSTPRQKRSQYQPTKLKWSNFRSRTNSISSYTKTRSSLITHTEINSIWTTHAKCEPHLHTHTKKMILALGSKAKSVLTTYTTKSIASLHRSLVNLDTHCWKKIILMPRHQNQVIFDPYSNAQRISIHALKPCRIRSPAWIKSNPIPTVKSCHLRPPHEKSIPIPSPRKKSN